MTQDEYAMSSPPTEGEFVSGERSSWPTVVGVFGIIVSAFGYLGGCCGIASPFIMPWYVGVLENQNAPAEQIDQIRNSIPPMGVAVGTSIVGIALATFLLYGAIQLIKRRSKSRGLLLIWSSIQVCWAIIGVAIQFAITPTPQAQQGVTAAQQQMFQFLGMGCGLILGLALPVFLLIWLSRARIREEVASWDEQIYDPI